ncbi:alpha-hydroxy acid oxidase (plasmid) [Microvirga sp. RSM25]|uniref:alpha-hydroxy acid oxidase n=1 Tax=Microvirga sp. RSM25 TaxID=3273802 RepID=UPI00384B9CC0
MRDALTIDDFRLISKAKMPRVVFDYIDGGVEDELALAGNISAFQRHAFVPRYFRDVECRQHSVTLFDRQYDRCFGISPTGFASIFRSGADLMLARAARDAGIPFVLSGASNAPIEQVAAEAPGNVWFQVYGARNRAITKDLLQRAAGSGVETLVLTVDVPVTPKRTRNIRNGFGLPPRVTVASVIDAALHPGWTIRYLASGGLPKLGNWEPYAPPSASAMEVARVFAKETPDATQTMRDLETVRSLWKGKLLVKGILHPDDASDALKRGADGIWVSNHGGRQIDRVMPSIDALPSIRAAVGSKPILVIDSGIRRGADIAIARCLGADFAFVGRATLFGVAAAGEAGARRVINLLSEELDLVLGQIGCACVNELSSRYLVAGRTSRWGIGEAGPYVTNVA